MSTEWIQPALELFREACELPEDERPAFLDREAGEDTELRRHVEAMLVQDAAESTTLDTPLVSPGVRGALSELVWEAESDADAGSIPKTIGGYRILEELGHGAQAKVYLAEHETLHRQVALKVLRAPVTDGSSRSEQRFRREAEVTARIEHPNICSVYETGCSEGVTWIAMQYVPGSTLGAHLVRQREASGKAGKEATLHLPESDASSKDGSTKPSSGAARRSDLMRVVAFTEQAARALHVAHEDGLVHRDIKPGNLMVADDGRPVILDFGLAHTSGRDGSLGALGLTRSQDVLGTPHYMAPEQLRASDKVDRRTDVYALGVTLYECLTGRCPFDAVSIEALYQQILTVEPPRPRTLNPHISKDLEVVLLAAIEKEPGRRYQSALDFAEDLRRVRQYEPIRARPISTWGRMVRLARRHPAVASSLSIAAVSLVAGLVASLLFLQEAKGALAAQYQTIVDQYHDTSKAAARADVHGESTEMKARLRRMAEVVIAREDAGFLDRIRAQEEANRRSGGTSGTMSKQIEQLLRDALDLRPAGTAAVGDLLLFWVRGGLYTERLSPGRQSELIDRADLHLQVLSGLESTDVRVVRARIMLLDALNRADKYEEARDHVDPWLKAERASVPADSLRIALYESRLGASLLGIGGSKDAREVLERSVPTVVDAYPRAFYGNVAMANLLVWYDKDKTEDSQARAAELRRKLWQSVAETLNHGLLKHTSLDLVNVALGPSRRELWLWVTSIDSLRKPLSLEEVEEFEDRLDKLRDKLHVEDSDPLACLFSVLFRRMAVLQHWFLGSWHPVVERLNQLSLDYLEQGPKMHYAHEATSRRQRGEYLAARGQYAEAEKSFRRAVEVCPTVLLRAEFEGSLGSCLASRGQFEEAWWRLRKAYDVALELYGPWRDQTMRHVNGLVRLYRMWGKLDEAKAWHWVAIQQRKKPKDHLFLVETLWQFGQLQEARATIENAFGGKPGGPWVRLRRARLNLLEGKLDVAIKLADEEVAWLANTKERVGAMRRREVGTAAHRVWAQALFARGAAKASLEHFELGAKDLRVEGDGFWSDYGKALVADRPDPDAGRERLERLTKERIDDPLAWHARARFLATTDGLTKEDRKKAVECAERANELCKRRRAFVLAMLAEAQFQVEEVESAQKTAAEVRKLMADRDAQWLSVKQAEARFTRYR